MLTVMNGQKAFNTNNNNGFEQALAGLAALGTREEDDIGDGPLADLVRNIETMRKVGLVSKMLTLSA